MARPRHEAAPGPAVTIVDLRSQVSPGVLAIGAEAVRLTWRMAPAVDGLGQLAYEVEAARDDGFEDRLATSGVVESDDQVGVVAPGPPLRSREVRFHRVRALTPTGWTPWSPTLRVEAGLLDAADWSASAVTLPDDPGRERQSPSPILRREVELPARVAKARLYVTSLGLHRLTINGDAVSEDLLAPGWTAYRRRLLVETYDVTALLRPGTNVIVATLGDGWYRGRLGWSRDRDRCHYGRDVALLAQLEVELADGTSQTITTDERWLASTGEIQSADLYDGSVVDLRERLVGCEAPGFDTSGWRPAVTVPLDPAILTPRVAPPVRVVETLPRLHAPARGADGRYRLDAGQNISGYVRLRVRGERGDRVTLRHAEVLEPDGSLHSRALRSAKATDVYVLADDEVTELEPAFTFHGFRHVEVDTAAEVLAVEFVAISSDMPRRGWFACSDDRLTRLHENVVWSQRDNFVSVPTDCPQRDERLGWTGDAQAFAPTACTLFDAQAFWTSWLVDLAHEQDDELGVPTVVPDVVLDGESRFGRAGWADAATIVPWAVYEAFGDRAILRRQLESMRRWVDSLVARQGEDGLLGPSMQFGDWLDPDAPVDRPWEAKADARYLANAFFAHSARLLAQASALLGGPSMAASYDAVADRVAAVTWATWAGHAVSTQTGAAVALRFDLVPAAQREGVVSALAALVRDSGGRVATGFLGTPLVLPALADAGHFDEAYRMLLRRELPSWLYQVDHGATTVWERWDAILPDGSIHPGTMTAPPEMPDSNADGSHMLSFNHYAYGAVIDWVYRHVAGLAPDPDEPGYRRVRLAPKPAHGIDWARAAVDAAYGLVSIEWRLEAPDRLVVDVDLPFGTRGMFLAPATAHSRITIDDAPAVERADLGPGRHAIVVTRPRIASGAAQPPATSTVPA